MSAHVVFVAAGPSYAIGGVFDNREDAMACAETFKDRFAYVQTFNMNEQLRMPMSTVRVIPATELEKECGK